MASTTLLTRSLSAILAFLLILQVLAPLVAADPIPEAAPEPAPKKPKGSSGSNNNTTNDESMAAFGAIPDTVMVGMSFLAFLASRFW